MKYCLSIRKKNLEPYMITGFNKIRGFEHLTDTSLQDIVKFTHSFENEVQLIYFLIENNLVPIQYFNGVFGIDYFKSQNDSTGKTLQYGISFQNDAMFYDTGFLQIYYARHLQKEEFLQAFLQKYYKILKDVPIFRSDLENIKSPFNRRNEYRKGIVDSAISFVKYYTMVKKDKGYIPNFTRIRDLAMFAINYERLGMALPEYDLDTLNNILNHYKELEQGNLTEEERDAYTKQVEELENQVELTEMYLKRSK